MIWKKYFLQHSSKLIYWLEYETLTSLLFLLVTILAIVSETWEREEFSLEKLLQMKNHKIISYKRPKIRYNKQPGGSCAIIYNDQRFSVQDLKVDVPRGVEVTWAPFKPKLQTAFIKNIIIASIYVSPSSHFKTATIDHLISSIQVFRSKFNEVRFILGGDLNTLNV